MAIRHHSFHKLPSYGMYIYHKAGKLCLLRKDIMSMQLRVQCIDTENFSGYLMRSQLRQFTQNLDSKVNAPRIKTNRSHYFKRSHDTKLRANVTAPRQQPTGRKPH